MKWVEAITHHFWHCASDCERSEEKLKDNWVGVVHHVCGEHEWACGSCNHGLLVNEEPDEYLNKTQSCMEALRDVVLDKKFMDTLPYYVRSRHTGCLENFNGMLTKYTPKRNAFEYDYFIARTELAAIDQNFHSFRPYAYTQNGKLIYHRKYSKRTKKYSVSPVKVVKSYKYVRKLIKLVLTRRGNDFTPMATKVTLAPNHPKWLSPTLAIGHPPPRTSILVKEKLARK